MSNDVLRTHNDINSLNFGGFEAVDYDIFFALCIKMRNTGDKKITLAADELREFIGSQRKDKKNFARALVATNDKLLSLKTKRYQKGVIGFNVFQAYYVPEDGSELTVLFSEPARYLITDSVNQFIHTRWDEYTLMTTAYSRRLYILLKQWRTVGGHKWSMEDWRSLMGVPDSYKTNNIDQQIIKPSQRDFEAAGCFKNLKIIKTKEGKGNRITHIEFKFTREEKDLFPELRKKDTKSKAEKISDIAIKEVTGTATPEMSALKDTIQGEQDWLVKQGFEDPSVSDSQLSFSVEDLFASASDDTEEPLPRLPGESFFSSLLRRVFKK